MTDEELAAEAVLLAEENTDVDADASPCDQMDNDLATLDGDVPQ